jgi:hypothetical protein
MVAGDELWVTGELVGPRRGVHGGGEIHAREELSPIRTDPATAVIEGTSGPACAAHFR